MKRSITSASPPQTNGLTERTSRTFKTRLARVCSEKMLKRGGVHFWSWLEVVKDCVDGRKTGSKICTELFVLCGWEESRL